MTIAPVSRTIKFISLAIIMAIGAIICCLACCALSQHEGFDDLNKMHE